MPVGVAQYHPFVAVHRRGSYISADRSLEDTKRVVILAGILFFIAIVCVLTKLDVEAEQVVRWSPLVWLIGVFIAGTIMNLVCYCRKKIKDRKRRARMQQRDLLYALTIPQSFPCLAPAPHVGCCRAPEEVNLPSYDQVVKLKAEEDMQPPKYAEALAMFPGDLRQTSISPSTSPPPSSQTPPPV